MKIHGCHNRRNSCRSRSRLYENTDLAGRRFNISLRRVLVKVDKEQVSLLFLGLSEETHLDDAAELFDFVRKKTYLTAVEFRD